MRWIVMVYKTKRRKGLNDPSFMVFAFKFDSFHHWSAWGFDKEECNCDFHVY